MNKDDVLKALKTVKDNSPKRNFKQTCDLIINVKGLDLKKTENQIDLFVQVPHERGKKTKVCGLVAPELKEASKKACDFTVDVDEFDKYAKDKKLTKKLAEECDFFIAQANIMPKVATAFGRILGPKGKMPNPKAGCIVPPNANLAPLVAKLQSTVRVSIKTSTLFQCRVGNEESKEEPIADNIMTIYTSLVHALPGEENNIKSVYLKLTMGPCFKIGQTTEEKADNKKAKKSLLGKKHTKTDKPKEENKKVEKKE